MALYVLAGLRDRPVAGNRVKQASPRLERALVVAEPVVALPRVERAVRAAGQAQKLAMRGCRPGGRRRGQETGHKDHRGREPVQS
jgi:hypothetical protein